MIPRGLLAGIPIAFEDVRNGDVIDTYNFQRGELSRFHRRKNQTVEQGAEKSSCDFYTDYDMICRNLGLDIQLIHRPGDHQ